METTCVQRGIYISQCQSPMSDLFNVGGFARIKSCIDVDAFKAAINLLLKRHEILRAHVTDRSSEVLSFEEGTPANIGFIDFSTCESADEQALSWMQEDFHVSMWDTGQLFRTTIIKVHDQLFYWYIKVHHLIVDGYSMSLMFEETASIYQQLMAGKDAVAQSPVRQYAAYAAQEKVYLASDSASLDRAWWKAYAIDTRPDIIHAGHPTAGGKRKALQSRRHTEVVSRDLAGKISAFAQQRHISAAQYMLAVFALAISRLFQQLHLVVGLPVLNRRSEDKTTIGPFLNVLSLVLNAGSDPAFEEWLDVVGKECRGIYRHSKLPASEVLDMTDRQRPLYNILFSYQHFHFDSRFHDVPAEINMLGRNEQEEGLVVQILDYQSGQPACMHFEYRESYLTREQVSSLSAVYVQLLETCIDHTQQRILQIPILPAVPPTYAAWMAGPSSQGRIKHILVALSEQTLLQKNRTALICQKQTYSYEQISYASDVLAHRLMAVYAAHPEERRIVGIHLERSAGMVVAILAVLKSGGCYVPIDINLPSERMAYIISDSGLQTVITTAHLWENRQHLTARSMFVDRIMDEEHTGNVSPLPLPDIGAPAYLMYTSGSTGKPKGVVISHAALANFLSAMQHELKINEQDSVMAVTNISFDISILELLLPLVCGGRVHMITEQEMRDPLTFARSVATSGITFIQGTPSLFRLLISAGWEGISSATILCGGEPIDMTLARELMRRGKTVWNMYGPTETTVWSAMHRLQPDDEKIYIGKPILNTDILILDQYGHILPPGYIGEIGIGGAGLSSGYHYQPGLTNEKFIPHPLRPGEKIYRTGDIGRWTNGLLEILGRNDEQVKIRGHRVETGEIAHQICQYPGVDQAAVLVVQSGSDDSELWAFYTAQQEVPVNSLLLHLRSLLPAFMCPQYFTRLPTFPLTPNGKIDRKALLEGGYPKLPAIMEYVPPNTPEEVLLARLWEELLSQHQVGINDNFFELGGHSLKATRLISAIISETGLAITLADVFEYPTIRSLAARMTLLGWIRQEYTSGVQTLSVNNNISISI
ncbi:amino acid adenylation domain-containing protein [Chitinophaga sp. B61]|uniref:Amino acid adenylation domain-containing protein n=1 Tax=Chitinophaga rhizophila TaxID=2866212 RepID=A0ABS7GHN6_9BACT|nr:amino acid adenylation domain-containing protein [Chitinophaga rhizophila]